MPSRPPLSVVMIKGIALTLDIGIQCNHDGLFSFWEISHQTPMNKQNFDLIEAHGNIDTIQTSVQFATLLDRLQHNISNHAPLFGDRFLPTYFIKKIPLSLNDASSVHQALSLLYRFPGIGIPIIKVRGSRDRPIFKQDRRWNADKPSATLDP